MSRKDRESAEVSAYVDEVWARAESLANCYPNEPQKRAAMIAVALATERWKASRETVAELNQAVGR